MREIKSILFPTDFSETAQNAFRYALKFADFYGASVKILHVIYPEAEPLDFPVVVAQANRKKIEVTEEVIKSFVEAGISQVLTSYSFKNTPVIDSAIQVGLPASLIGITCEQEKMDLIIMGTSGEHSTLDKIFGSVTTNTLAHAPCPVLVVPEKALLEDTTKVGYATDLQEADPYHIWEIGELLKPFNPILSVVHVQEKKMENKPISVEDLEHFFKGNAPALQITYHSLSGKDVVNSLAEFAENFNLNLLVMHSPRRNFLERFFHKSITKKAAYYTKIPLLILK